jgi:hypothetical protein
MLKKVHLTVTSTANGYAGVVPYSHEHGLDTFKDALGQRYANVYKVPAYEVKIDDGDTYLAVRYGFQNKGDGHAPKTRNCDAGIAHRHMCLPTWKQNYGPHSFHGTGLTGAWILFPHKTFYIHEGPDRAKNGIGGSLGCIEILDGKWDDFLQQIESLGNGTCEALGAAGKLHVSIKAGSYPTGTFLGAFPVVD